MTLILEIAVALKYMHKGGCDYESLFARIGSGR